MITSKFQDMDLSLLGFGAMRLPLKAGGGPGDIDEALTAAMVRRAYEAGVNYYDTAYVYHNGESEKVMGRVLREYPRDSWYLASKFAGHLIASSFDPRGQFEEQLEKCGVDYFDFYLLHNVYENSMKTYRDQRWGIIDYFVEQKKRGRIRHLGFSTHGGLPLMKEFLDSYGDIMEFCQIQLNYVDWTLQEGKEKYEFLRERGIPIWVMEGIRGGKLASLEPEDEAKLKALRGDESAAAWCFRWLQGLEGVKVILSGMSTLAQVEDNLRTFAVSKPLNSRENALIMEIAEGLKDSVPCTGCRYCCESCPQGLDIPWLLSLYNRYKVAPTMDVGMQLDLLPKEKQPPACIKCGACSALCPQHIDIPQALEDFSKGMPTLPNWAEISRQREENARKAREAAARGA